MPLDEVAFPSELDGPADVQLVTFRENLYPPAAGSPSSAILDVELRGRDVAGLLEPIVLTLPRLDTYAENLVIY